MQYFSVIPAVFLERPNRFVAYVNVNGKIEVAHVKNTGRCRELLIPGCRVYLSVPQTNDRKTKYDLIAVEKQRGGKEPLLINMDSQLPNAVVAEWLPKSNLFSTDAEIRREVCFGSSRFDFFVQDGSRRAFLEVKGVTLEEDGIAMFPDAPTERGVKHLNELCACVEQGLEAYVLFVIQMQGMHEFRPNDRTHEAFGEALRKSKQKGVKILALDCFVTADSVVIDSAISVNLSM